MSLISLQYRLYLKKNTPRIIAISEVKQFILQNSYHINLLTRNILLNRNLNNEHVH